MCTCIQYDDNNDNMCIKCRDSDPLHRLAVVGQRAEIVHRVALLTIGLAPARLGRLASSASGCRALT